MRSLQCSHCHQDIIKKYYTKLSSGSEEYFFCSLSCFQQWREQQKFCFSCGGLLFASSDYYQYGDGRVSCKQCYKTSVRDEKTFLACRKKVLRFLLSRYGYLPPCDVVPQLHDRFVFQTCFEMVSDDIQGVYGLYHERHFTLCRIAILRGLPADICESVLAHEYAHDLMYHHWGYIENKMLQEGFARYIEYQYNSVHNNTSRNETLLAKPKKYGSEGDPYYDGLKIMLSAERTPGNHLNVFEFIDKNRNRNC